MLLGWLALAMPALSAQAARTDKSGQPARQDQVGKQDQLENPWREVQKDGEITLISKYPAPVPFSMTGQPEAILGMEAAIIGPGKDTLKSLVAGEVKDLRNTVLLDDYEEQDGKKPVKGIAVWYETIEGTQVAFIKYRGVGVVGKPPGLAMTAIHSLFIKGNRVFYTHLIVKYAGHQDEVRHDQRFIIRGMIESENKRLAKMQ